MESRKSEIKEGDQVVTTEIVTTGGDKIRRLQIPTGTKGVLVEDGLGSIQDTVELSHPIDISSGKRLTTIRVNRNQIARVD